MRHAAHLRGCYTVTITAKGQFTVPMAIQRRLHLRKGDPVEIEIIDDDRFAMRFLRSEPLTR